MIQMLLLLWLLLLLLRMMRSFSCLFDKAAFLLVLVLVLVAMETRKSCTLDERLRGGEGRERRKEGK